MSFNLAIDIGNSRSKFGLFEGRKLLEQKVFKNDDLEKNNELILASNADAIIISSVNRKAESALQLDRLKTPVVHLNHELPLPFQMEYDTPETLGKDRMAAVAGAMSSFSKDDLLVIDAGSCITYDFLTATHRYLGGAITPGLQMRLKAMHEFTDALPLIQWEESSMPQVVGKTTIASMLSGAVHGVIGEMNGFISSYKTQYSALKVVLTGGDANFFEKELKNGIFADPNLVLKGLNEILVYNRE